MCSRTCGKADHNFSKADKDKAMNYVGFLIMRTIVLDRMVKQYLEKHAKYSCYKYCTWTGYLTDVIGWRENICTGNDLSETMKI